MVLTNEKLIKEFSKENEYVQNLSQQQIRDIVYGPWKLLKREMKTGNLNPIRFKYFGVFQVRKNRAKYMLKKLEDDYKNGNFTENKQIKIRAKIKKLENIYKEGEIKEEEYNLKRKILTVEYNDTERTKKEYIRIKTMIKNYLKS